MTLSSEAECNRYDGRSEGSRHMPAHVIEPQPSAEMQASVLENNYSGRPAQDTATSSQETVITAIKDLDVELASQKLEIVDQKSSSPTRRGWSDICCTSQIQFMAVCFSLFLSGWNDSSIGPLLPRIQDVYRVSRFHLCL